ncbi:unnamed protein product [Timema podura]|uniref:Uncharacterized protein n=1 Tax=Timema podura TaxID=61482 RepID=A0ABN7NJE3_TIMPD|nr:unnamed protein product [Timema podura]
MLQTKLGISSLLNEKQVVSCEKLHVGKFEAKISTDNIQSIALFSKLGFQEFRRNVEAPDLERSERSSVFYQWWGKLQAQCYSGLGSTNIVCLQGSASLPSNKVRPPFYTRYLSLQVPPTSCVYKGVRAYPPTKCVPHSIPGISPSKRHHLTAELNNIFLLLTLNNAGGRVTEWLRVTHTSSPLHPTAADVSPVVHNIVFDELTLEKTVDHGWKQWLCTETSSSVTLTTDS